MLIKCFYFEISNKIHWFILLLLHNLYNSYIVSANYSINTLKKHPQNSYSPLNYWSVSTILILNSYGNKRALKGLIR